MNKFNLYITKGIVKQIEDEVIKSYPYEVCGVMMGRSFNDGFIVLKAQQMEGLSRHKWAFEINIREWMTIIREGRREGYRYIGLYHSHPDAQPIPSNADIHRMLECPGEIWLIVSIFREGKVKMAAYTMPSASSALARIPIEIVGGEIAKSELGINNDFTSFI